MIRKHIAVYLVNTNTTNTSDVFDEREPNETDMNLNYPISETKSDQNDTYEEFYESWKKKRVLGSRKAEDDILRELFDAFLLNTAVELNEDNISSILNKGDFFIARRVWNKTKGKYHDHFAIVKERCARN